MGNQGTLESRLKKIRKELSLIDDDLKSLNKAAATGLGAQALKPRLKSRQLREKEEMVSRPAARAVPKMQGSRAAGKSPQKAEPLKQDKKAPGGDERFLEYLSSSFNSGVPLRQERRLQRNKAIVMLVIVLFFLFLVVYRMMM